MASPPPSAPDSSGVACPHCGETHPTSYTHCPKTGKALTSGRALVGRTIAGRYKIIGLLGEGGMGAVYVAEHTMIGRKVAIKRLHPELASDEKAVQRFQREARAAASTGHEHIVEILDLGYAEDGAPYLVMEYLRGQSLAALLRKDTRIPAKRACEIIGQMLAALDAVHRQQIVHRDLKPDNVFLTRRQGNNDYVKILDFGISKMKRDEGEAFDLTRTGVMLGTPFYMSPEQARGMKNLDHRVDLYAAGVILYECLTGRVPYEADNYHQLLQAILRNDPIPIRSISSDVEPQLEAIVHRAIAKDPGARYPSAAAMLAALVSHGARLPGGGDVIETGEGPAVTLPGALRTTSTVTPEALGQQLERMGPDAPGAAQTPLSQSSEEQTTSQRNAPQPRPSIAKADPARPAARPQPAPTPAPGGARYFFAASDDWDEARARTANEARASTPSFRGPPSAPREGMLYAPAVREATPSLRDPGPGSDRLARATLPGENEPTSSGDSALRSASAEPEVKGALLVAALDHVESLHGASSLEAIRAHMDRDALARLGGVILPMAWLPLSLYDQLLRAVERAIGGGEGSTSSAIGRATADRELPTTHRLFMQTASPAAAAERIPQIFRLYHAKGEARVSPAPGSGVRVEIDSGAPESLPYAWAMAGFWHRMLELTGARDVRTAVVNCRGRGDHQTAIALRWR